MANQNMVCKACRNSFHHCSSCDSTGEDWLNYGYCSRECWRTLPLVDRLESGDVIEDVTEAAKLLNQLRGYYSPPKCDDPTLRADPGWKSDINSSLSHMALLYCKLCPRKEAQEKILSSCESAKMTISAALTAGVVVNVYCRYLKELAEIYRREYGSGHEPW